MMERRRILAFGAGMISSGLFATAPVEAAEKGRWPSTSVNNPTPTVKGMPAALARNLANFDDLDFHVYTGQQWENLHRSHAQDILVHYPDGHTTRGIPDHIKEL